MLQTCAIKCVDDNAADYVDQYALDTGPKVTGKRFLESAQDWPVYPPATCTQGKVLYSTNV
jgi:hypothetical protein